MAAYGALVSVMHILDQIHRHPRPPISIRKQHVESLTANVKFLQQFLEGYNPHLSYSAEADPLESRIAEAAYAAEDVIESYIVDQIHSRSSDHAQQISSIEFEKDLEKVIEEMDVIKLEVKKKMKEKKNMGVPIIKKSTADAGLSISSSSTAQKVTTVVGFDEALNEMLDKITGGGVDRRIIPIVGMGGLGKTTLARNIVVHPLIKEKFHICAWSTISQMHNASKILNEILNQVDLGSGGDLSEGDLGDKLYKYLIGRRYLIVLDDIWSIEAWDSVRHYFPNNTHGSRIVVTTRLSNLASMFGYSNGLDMKFLDNATSWNLFSKIVFGEETCPLELEGIGKKIVKGCRGLPLSIVVIGGLLSKSEATREHWEVIEENLNSIANSVEDGSCLQILYLSYNDLPVHIKPCFLYLAIYKEDEKIPFRILIPLLVAEGLVKPIDGKSLEEAAEEYLEELVARNLLLVEKRNHHGELKEVKMHDLVRDVCLREAQKDKFLYLLGEHSIPASMTSQRRIVCTFIDKTLLNPFLESVGPSSSLVRSLIFFSYTLPISSFRLLRVCLGNVRHTGGECSDKHYEELRLVNLRLVNIGDYGQFSISRVLSQVNFPWNLQTLLLVVKKGRLASYILDIWKMPLLRHVMTAVREKLYVPDLPLSDDELDEDVLKNLHTLSAVSNLNFGEGVPERIPNIRILKLAYHQREEEEEEEEGDYSLQNLCRLHKLQDLKLYTSVKLTRELSLPHSLKKLVLKGTKLPWEDMKAKIGCLPLLQVLKLEEDSFTGSEWEAVEGQFLSLKFLLIDDCDELEYWVADNTHFPCLEHLVLCCLRRLRGIPLSIGDIPTLRSITVDYCSYYADDSARRIVEEQEELGNEDIQLEVIG